MINELIEKLETLARSEVHNANDALQVANSIKLYQNGHLPKDALLHNLESILKINPSGAGQEFEEKLVLDAVIGQISEII